MTLFLSILMYVAFIGVSYLAGSVNNAIIICRLLGYDIRSLGSGNPGAMNMIRSVGLWWGVLTLVMDALKGALPALAGWFFLGDFCSFEGSRIGACLCGLGVIAGHIFPVYYKFKGGKGVASTLGICMVLNPLLGALSFLMLTAIRFAYEHEHEAERYFEFGYFERVHTASNNLKVRDRTGN